MDGLIDLGIDAVELSKSFRVDRRSPLFPRSMVLPAPPEGDLRIEADIWTLTFRCGCQVVAGALGFVEVWGAVGCSRVCAATLVVMGVRVVADGRHFTVRVPV